MDTAKSGYQKSLTSNPPPISSFFFVVVVIVGTAIPYHTMEGPVTQALLSRPIYYHVT